MEGILSIKHVPYMMLIIVTGHRKGVKNVGLL